MELGGTSNERPVNIYNSAMAAKNAEELVAEEEREKRKAEKRKAKKKRRREKKKEEKEKQANSKNNNNESISKQESNSNSKKNNKNNKSSKSSPDRPSSPVEEQKIEEEEEFLDPNSAFVSVAVSKKKKSTTAAITHMERTRPAAPRKQSDSDDQTVAESERLAVVGYNMASQERYEEAVEYFSKAIRLVHNDHRFLSNRSFCYCQLEQYAKALKDADKAITLAPTSPKGYYRRGEALKGLKQFKQAEQAFERVLQLDEDCEDAKQELENVKIQQLLEMGFGEEQAYAAVQQYHTVQAAVEALTSIVPEPVSATNGDTGADDIFFSEEEGEEELNVPSVRPLQMQNGKTNKMDPSNPEGHLSLWVGNITHEVTEKQLIELFSKYGVVLSVRLLPEKFCAFINFRDKSAPGPAMKNLQSYVLGGERLVIRYPNNPVPEAHQQIIIKKTVKTPGLPQQTKVTGPVNGDECHFWRTTGCAFGSKCRYKHLKENKGVDKKPWHKSN
ncbi:RNA polymerase II-associated protein 3 isoform X2 [Anabrus simplex]|uniref:RNA polymerase II-associated protein 3 isoform X2 n=1 Tax=Anabrus simplex TaxID=316456 RepID=UPI0035A39AEB